MGRLPKNKTMGKNKAKISHFQIRIILASTFVVLSLFVEFKVVTEREVVEKSTKLTSRTNLAVHVDVNADTDTTDALLLVQTQKQQQICDPTTNYRLSQLQGQEIILQSYYGSKEKTTGGDEFYSTIIFNNSPADSSTVVAVGRVSDLSDGRYAVVFKSLVELEKYDNFPDTRSRFYNVSLTNNSNGNGNGNGNGNNSGFALKNILQYSCGEGALPPPSKEFKPFNGAINREVHMEFPLSWIQMEKPLQQTQPQIDLNNFDRVIALGDSLMDQLLQGSKSENEVAPPWTFDSIQSPLFSDTLKHFLDPIRKCCKDPNRSQPGRRFLGNDTHRLSLHVPAEGVCSTNKTLLLLNSGVWDLLDDGTQKKPSKSKTCCDYDADFKDHVAALRMLLSFIRHQFKDVTIGWKSMTAVHVHGVVDCKNRGGCANRVKYMSSSRAEAIFQKQKDLIRQEFPDVLFIDLYNLTYPRAHQVKYNDGRHYQCLRGVNVCRDMWNEAFGNSGSA